jgi:hypothetical protein
MTKSMASWVPAVPPPPVAGGALTGAAVGFDGAVALAFGLAVMVLVVTPAFGATLAADENEVSADPGVEVEDVEQADTAAETTMVMAPQPATLNTALSPAPAMVVRTLIEPPHAADRQRPTSPPPAPETAPEGNTRGDPVAARADRRQVPESAGGHEGKAHGRHRHTTT